MVDKGKEEEINGSGGGGKELMLVPSYHASSGGSYKSPLPVRELPPSSNYYPYPSPLAKYEEVATDPKLFMETLGKLHLTMGTKFMIPIIGGKELDLHRLFFEVTSRGGIEKVVRERRWREVTAVFNFPSTATNASFILRKYYVSLIYHYEQIYFFGAQGWTPSSADPFSSPSPTPNAAKASREPVTPSEVQVSNVHKRSRVNASLGSPVIGVIDGKFEHGYLVTVTVGAEKLKGILYHPFDHRTAHVSTHSGNIPYNIGKDYANSGICRRRRRKKSEMKRRDPAHPKPNRSGYNFFFAEQHARLKPLHPGKDREISKMIGELWNNITETEKAVYQEKGLKDKERYRSEMEEYKERLRTGHFISNVVPIQQRHAVLEVEMVEEAGHEIEADIVEASHEMEPDMVKVGHEMEPDIVEVGHEMEVDEGDSLHTLENGSSSGASGSEGKTADKDSETEISAGDGIGAESSKAAEEDLAAEGVGFELRKRDQNCEDESAVEATSKGKVEEEESKN